MFHITAPCILIINFLMLFYHPLDLMDPKDISIHVEYTMYYIYLTKWMPFISTGMWITKAPFVNFSVKKIFQKGV